MRVALIHDYITSYGGAEKTFKVLTEIFPQAEVYTLFYDPEILKKIFRTNPKIKKEIHTSFLQKFPNFLKKKYQLLLPFLPIAVETLDFRDFDLVISSSFSFAKGIITRPKTTHICYCYSPTRYLWTSQSELKYGKNPVSKLLFNYIRIWDRQASERVDRFIAISKTVQQRIKKYYKRDSVVIYPPVSTQNEPVSDWQIPKPKKEFYLIVSQLRKYKRIDLAIKAFNKLGLKLVIIGEGPEKRRLKSLAKKNIKILGWQSDKTIAKYYKNCTAFIFPGEDDFGIAPVEAMSYGKPVLAYKKGGAIETIIEGKTGEFFDSYSSSGKNINSAVLANGVRRLRQNLPNYDPKFIHKQSKKFSQKRFKKEFLKFIKKIMLEN